MKIHNSIPVLLGTLLLVVTAASVSCRWLSSSNSNPNYGKDMSELDEESQEDSGPSINHGSGPVSISPAVFLGLSKFPTSSLSL